VADGEAEAAPLLDLDEVSDVLKLVDETDIIEFEMKSKRFSLSVRKKEAQEPVPAAAPAMQAMPMPMQPMPMQPMPMAAPPPAAPEPAPAAPEPAPAAAPEPAPAAPVAGTTITSPMAGTFYRAPAPGEPAFVQVGDTVTKGQVICIVEAMKLMNEIESEVDGVVVDIIVDDASPVTPGMGLIVIN